MMLLKLLCDRYIMNVGGDIINKHNPFGKDFDRLC